MNHSILLNLFSDGLNKLGIVLSPTQQKSCIDYLFFLETWNQKFNLTGIKTVEKMVGYHLLDSLAALPYFIPHNESNDRNMVSKKILDMGTGAGLPGIPLAIAQPKHHFTLCDSTQKKTQFLSRATEHLHLRNISIVTARVEQYHVQKPNEYFDFIVCRAVADLPQLWEWAKPLLKTDGKLIAWKGQYPEPSTLDLFTTETFEIHPLTVPQVEGARHLVIIQS